MRLYTWIALVSIASQALAKVYTGGSSKLYVAGETSPDGLKPYELSASDVNTLWPGWYSDDKGPTVYLYKYLAQLAPSDTKNTTVNCLCQSGYKCSCDEQHSYSYFKDLAASKRTFVNGKYPEEYVYRVQLVINGTDAERTTATVPKQTTEQVDETTTQSVKGPISTKVPLATSTAKPVGSTEGGVQSSAAVPQAPCTTPHTVWWTPAPSSFNGAGGGFGNVYSTTAKQWTGDNGQWNPSKYGENTQPANTPQNGANSPESPANTPENSVVTTAAVGSSNKPKGVLGLTTESSDSSGGANGLRFGSGALVFAFLLSWV